MSPPRWAPTSRPSATRVRSSSRRPDASRQPPARQSAARADTPGPASGDAGPDGASPNLHHTREGSLMNATTVVPELADIDLSDLSLWKDGPPHELFERLRNDGGLHWSGLGDFE